MCIIVTAGQNYSAFTGAEIDWYGASVAYIGIPVFLAVFFYHKIKHKTHLIPLKEVNLSRINKLNLKLKRLVSLFQKLL